MSKIFEKNLEMLEKCYPDIFEKIKNLPRTNPEEYQVVMTRYGNPTIRVNTEDRCFYIHSKYDPVGEAERFVREHYTDNTSTYIIYGFGFAYHIQKLLEKKEGLQIKVYETNKHIFRAALENVDLGEIFKNANVDIVLEDSLESFAHQFKEALKTGNKKVLIHLPSLQAMPKGFLKVKYLLENYRIVENSINSHKDILGDNFNYNIHNYHQNVDVLFRKFENIPIIIVSAGPSLDKNKNLLKKVKNRVLILSVGTALKPLIDAGVYPDMIIITDPKEVVYNQLEGLEIDIPIIVLSTCSKKVLQNYKGFKFLALQEGYGPAEQYARKNNNRLVRTGGSVATTALDIAIKLGCNPIIFVGQDLAYTNGETHVRGTYFYRKVKDNKGLRPVEGVNGNIVYTSKNLYIYLKWIEQRIKQEKEISFIDATEGGAKIEGTIIMPLKQVIDRVLKNKSYLISERIEEVIEKANIVDI